MTASESRRLKLRWEQLEVRRVLDASAMPLWDRMPEVAGQALTLDTGLTATANAQVGDFTFLSGEITGYTGAGGAVEIPSLLGGVPVRAIGGWAFRSNTSITSITIPDSVISISDYAFFGCTSLTSVKILASVTSIGRYVFNQCINLTSVNIPASVTGIGDCAFGSCTRLPSIAIPASVTSIGTSAFYCCTSLQSVLLPPSVTRLEMGAFERCGAIKSISIPSSVTSIGERAFHRCTELTSITVASSNASYASIDGILYDKSLSTVVQCPGGEAGEVAIPASVTSIGAGAFSFCTYLTSVTIPASVTILGIGAFSSCVGLTSVTIPASVKSIGYEAFSSCTSLASVTIPASVTSIGDGAFSSCASLASVTIPASVTSIGDGAFSSCTSLAVVTISAGVTSIGWGAFAGCTLLTSVTVPSSVTRIRGGAFSNCRSITVASSNASYASIDGILYDKSLSTVVQCPGGKAGEVAIPASVTSIGAGAFSFCTYLTSVTIPASVTSIGEQAFRSCANLKSVTISAGVTSIGYLAFADCTDLQAVCFLGAWPLLGPSCFSGCSLTVFHLANTEAWPSTYGGAPVKVFQSVEVGTGINTEASIGSSVDRVLKQGAGTAVLSTPSTRTGGTVVEAGELVLQNKDALGTGLLEVQTGAKATLQIGYDTVAVTSLNLAATARLELGTSKLSVAANGFTESDIRTKLTAGRNGGLWNGASGITSTFAGGDRAIGYRVADGALEVAYAAPGDSNLDGVFDILDIGDILSSGRFNTGDAANWTQGDTNYDGVFDIVDIADILGTNLFNQGNYLTQGSVSSAATESGTVTTFDPALVFAALSAESTSQPTTKRKSF